MEASPEEQLEMAQAADEDGMAQVAPVQGDTFVTMNQTASVWSTSNYPG